MIGLTFFSMHSQGNNPNYITFHNQRTYHLFPLPIFLSTRCGHSSIEVLLPRIAGIFQSILGHWPSVVQWGPDFVILSIKSSIMYILTHTPFFPERRFFGAVMWSWFPQQFGPGRPGMILTAMKKKKLNKQLWPAQKFVPPFLEANLWCAACWRAEATSKIPSQSPPSEDDCVARSSKNKGLPSYQ